MRSAFSTALLLVALAAGCADLDPRDNPLDPGYTGPRGDVAGKVILHSGKALRFDDEDGAATLDYGGVQVSVDRIPGAVTATARGGEFELRGVPVGVWTVRFTHADYVTSVVRAVGVRKSERTELDPVTLEERVAGTLIFGSSREGWPSVFRSDPYGRDVRNLSVLPLQSDACRYLRVLDREALVFQSQFFVYEEDGAYKTASGIYAASYPDLAPIAHFEGDPRMSRAMFAGLKVVFAADYNGDKFIAAARTRRDLDGDWEALRITGAKGDKWQETLPAVSDDGRIAYVRTGEDESGMPWSEIRVLDGLKDTLGELVWSRDLLTILKRVAESRAFDFDYDGADDLEKFGALFELAGLPAFTAGIDWSQPATSVAAFLQGPQPDGVHLDSVALLLEFLLLGEIRELAWLPDNDTLVFVDRVQSKPGYKARQLWKINNRGAPVTDYLGRAVTDPVSGRKTNYYFDINLDGAYAATVDRPFWYDNPGSYVDNVTIEFKRIESQVLRKVTASNPAAGDSYLFGASPNEWIMSPSVSPDGKRIAVALGPVEKLAETFSLVPIMTQGDIVTIDPNNAFVTRVTTDGLNNRAPCWAP